MQGAQPIILMVVMFAIFYFVLIRPQAKKQREHQEKLKKLDKGDMVLTRGGVIGKITGVNGDVLVIELQEKVRVRVPRSYIDDRWTDSAPGASETGAKAA